MAPSSRRIRDLTDIEVQKLTNLLSAPNAAPQPISWFNSQADKIPKLPKTLCRPQNVLSRSLSALRKPLERLNIFEEGAQLCKTHKPLNAQVIRRLFLRISSECTVRNARLQNADGLPNNIVQCVGRITKINSLWMSAALYLHTFALPSDTPHFDRIESGCEACIMASIGSNLQVLLDLQASAVSRRRGKTFPEILRFLDEWILLIGATHLEDENAALANEIRQCRKDLHAERCHGKERKKYASNSTPISTPTSQDGRKKYASISTQISTPTSQDERKTYVSNSTQISTPISPDRHESLTSPAEIGSALDCFDFGFEETYENQNIEAKDDDLAAMAAEDSIIDYYASRVSNRGDATASIHPAESMHPAFQESMFGGSQAGNSHQVSSSSRPPVVKHGYGVRGNAGGFSTGSSPEDLTKGGRGHPAPISAPGPKRTGTAYSESVYSSKTSGERTNTGPSTSTRTTRPRLATIESVYGVSQISQPETLSSARYKMPGVPPSRGHSHSPAPVQDPNTIHPSPPRSVWEDELIFSDDGRSVAETTHTTRETLRASQEEQDKAFQELTGMSKAEYDRQRDEFSKRGGNVRGTPSVMGNSRAQENRMMSKEEGNGTSSTLRSTPGGGGSAIMRGMRAPSAGVPSVRSEDTRWSAFGKHSR